MLPKKYIYGHCSSPPHNANSVSEFVVCVERERVCVWDQGQQDLILFHIWQRKRFPLTIAALKRALSIGIYCAFVYCISMSVPCGHWCCICCGHFALISYVCVLRSSDRNNRIAGCVPSCKTISLGTECRASHNRTLTQTHIYSFRLQMARLPVSLSTSHSSKPAPVCFATTG